MALPNAAAARYIYIIDFHVLSLMPFNYIIIFTIQYAVHVRVNKSTFRKLHFIIDYVASCLA